MSRWAMNRLMRRGKQHDYLIKLANPAEMSIRVTRQTTTYCYKYKIGNVNIDNWEVDVR